jgi:DtxR family Mn-dependent transcriptional regulator
MELLERLTRRQVDAMRVILTHETPAKGVALTRVAAGLRVSPPSALGHLTQLENLELVARYRGKSRLTPKGRTLLVEYQRHHRIAESLFRGLGLSPEEVCRAAREVDLALSHRMVERVCHAEGHPATCPHGEPIPPCSGQRSGG